MMPPTVPTDTIVPLHFWDDTCLFRDIILDMTMRIDDRLDGDKLCHALHSLLCLEGWRKFGGRLRRGSNGRLEYHVPAQYDEHRPSVAYYQQRLEMRISEHTLASQLPKAPESPNPALLPVAPDDLGSLVSRPGDPRTLDDYLHSDRPVLGLHIVSFTDATIVTFSWPHVLFDAMGRKALFDAWSLVLNGRADEVPPLQGAYSDPLATLGTRPTEPYKHVDKQLGLWGSLVFLARVLVDRLQNPGAMIENRFVRVPAAYVKALHDRALADVRGTDTAFVSEGDALSAWYARRLLQALGKSPASAQPLAVSNVFGLRRVLTDLLPAGRPYVGNTVYAISVFTTVREFLAAPLGHTAARIRRSYQEQGTREQVEAHQALQRKAVREGRNLAFSDPWGHMVSCSNWTQARFFDIDFSAAVVDEGPVHHAGQAPGRPSLVLGRSFVSRGGLPMVNAFTILGKDARGDVWLRGTLRKEHWANIERAFQADGVGSGL